MHMSQVIKKETRFALAIAGIAKHKWEAQFDQLQRLFNAVAAPRMDYASIIWHRPQDPKTEFSVTQTRRLSTVQRLIMTAMTGCFRTISTAALEIESDLLPTDLRLQKKVLNSALRLMTTPSDTSCHMDCKSPTGTQNPQIVYAEPRTHLPTVPNKTNGDNSTIHSTSIMEPTDTDIHRRWQKRDQTKARPAAHNRRWLTNTVYLHWWIKNKWWNWSSSLQSKLKNNNRPKTSGYPKWSHSLRSWAGSNRYDVAIS